MEPETRTLYRIDKTRTGGITGVHSGQYAMLKVELWAIPWCTTHDLLIENPNTDPMVCYDVQEYPPDCVVSSDGPDHKWWKDK